MRRTATALAALLLAATGHAAPAVDDTPLPAVEAADRADRGARAAAIRGGLGFLVAAQAEDGSWSPAAGPAVTALALRALVEAGRRPDADPAAAAALGFVLASVQPDGSIRGGPDGMLANYNTAICVSALSALPDDPRAAAAVREGVDFLRKHQWQAGRTDPAGDAVGPDHPYFGGAGYGRHGRPDLSNTQMMVQALHDAGVSTSDPAFQRAAAFVARCQGTPLNDFFPPGTIAPDGGFVYSTSEDGQNIGVPQSMASPGQQDPSVDAGDRRPVSGLRTYGSMTYAGFKSLLHAGLTPDDPRVIAARGWIEANHDLDRNPGMPDGLDQQGLFYFYLVYGQALEASGLDTLRTPAGGVDWRAALTAALAERQGPDGSWSNDADRWMEGDPNLATAFAVLALQAADR